MKNAVLISILFISSFGFSQLSGDIVVDGRKITSDISYTQEMKCNCVIVFDISVDTEGNITSCEWNKIESSTNKTRYIFAAKNRILTQLKFERGNGYPTFHRGKIIIKNMPIEE